jgi:parvulin-like peptidyl-prolyl isomerase
VTTVPSLTPTATPYTLEGFQSSYKNGLSFYAKLGMTEADFRKIYFESNLYQQRVSDIVTANVAHEQEQVWTRFILVADEVTAQSIRVQLLAGVDFAALAAGNSLDTATKDTGGDLGWAGKGKMPVEFETAAFALQVGEISQPVQDSSGWNIIQVLGHEIRPLTDTEYTAAVTAAFNQWLTDQRTGARIVVSGNWTANIPDQPSLDSAFADLYATATASAKQSPQQPTMTPTP